MLVLTERWKRSGCTLNLILSGRPVMTRNCRQNDRNRSMLKNRRCFGLALLALAVSGGGSVSAECTHPDNIVFLRSVFPNESIATVIARSRRPPVRHFWIFYKSSKQNPERIVSEHDFGKVNYYSVRLSFESQPRTSGIVTGYEFMNLYFNNQGAYLGGSCTRSYLAP